MLDAEPLATSGTRRVEAPVLIDRRGTVWTPGLIDVTLRLVDRGVLAESPPPGLTPELARSLLDAAKRLAGARGAAGAFIVSFSVDPSRGEYRLLGTAAGLPAASAVIEALNEIDLPALVGHLARGGTLDGELPDSRGHAAQIRLSALDPEDGFAPRAGVVEALRLPSGPGLRADAAVEEGEMPAADLEIARVTAHGRTRAEALARLQRGLARTEVSLRGGATDKAFLTEVLDRPELIARRPADPTWLDRLVAGGEHLPHRGAEVAVVAAAIAGYEAELDAARARFYASAARGRPEVPNEIGRAVELRHRGQDYFFHVSRLDRALFRVEVDRIRLEVTAGPLGRTGRTLTIGERSWRVAIAAQESRQVVEVDGIPHRVERESREVVRSPATGVVVSIAVQVGDEVAAGDPLAVLEAMKVETTVVADAPGRVRRVLARRHAHVGTGAPLLMLAPLAADATGAPSASSPGRRVRLQSLAPATDADLIPSPRAESLNEARRLMLGYDADLHTVERLASGSSASRAASTTGKAKAADLPREEEILRAFVDLSALFRRQTVEGPDGRHSAEEYLSTYLRDLAARGAGLPVSFLDRLRRALGHYHGPEGLDRSPELEESLFRIAISYRPSRQIPAVLALLESWLERSDLPDTPELRDLLDRLAAETQGREPAVHDLAREVRYRVFSRPLLLAARERTYAAAAADLARLAANPLAPERGELIRALVECTQPLHRILSQRYASVAKAPTSALRAALLEAMVRRYYRIRELGAIDSFRREGQTFGAAGYEHRGSHVHLIATHADYERLAWSVEAARRLAGEAPAGSEVVVDLYFWRDGEPAPESAVAAEIAALLASAAPEGLSRVAVTISGLSGSQHFTFRREPGGPFQEEEVYRGIHPMVALRLELWRLRNFHLDRLPTPEEVYLFHGVARENPRDERLFAVAEVRDFTPVRDEAGRLVQLPQLEHMLVEALTGMRRFQSRRANSERLTWNRVLLNVWPPVDLPPDEIDFLVRRLAPLAEGVGLEKVAVRCRIPDRETGPSQDVILRDLVMEISSFEEDGAVLRFRKPTETPLKPLREYAQKVVDLRRRGLPYPYEVIKRLTAGGGDFVEHDLDEAGLLVPVDRPYGRNTANVVVGVVRNFTARYPEGMTRVVLLGDPSRDLGALAEPECRRILAALDLASTMRAPVEWFALSGGARIALDSGTESMDWIGRVLRRLVELTQQRSEINTEVNIVVAGINAGAQPYWNAEATMLMHSRGILIMTPEGAMVLTGKRVLDATGGVSAEDNFGIGGYERIMGPNGEAQYFARDLAEACALLLRHYEHTYTAPGERFPRPAPSRDPRDRDVREFPHGGAFRTVGEVFSDATNPRRKKPFEIRRVLAAVADQDLPPLERWYGMRDAEIAVVLDAHLGGHPVCLLGFESQPLPRLGWAPVHGPDRWTGGTLFPLATKKIARAINAASGNRPLVVLANLSGFDGSPESMRQWQLEYGAELGRAVVSFQGPIVFCVISRYHGGAFVVFSRTLNDSLEVAALEGAHASVIGGAPAAAVAFGREVDERVSRDARVIALQAAIANPEQADKARLRAELAETRESVRAETLSEVAAEFDGVHTVQRALAVGSIHHIIAPERLRPYLIEAVERGISRAMDEAASP